MFQEEQSEGEAVSVRVCKMVVFQKSEKKATCATQLTWFSTELLSSFIVSQLWFRTVGQKDTYSSCTQSQSNQLF